MQIVYHLSSSRIGTLFHTFIYLFGVPVFYGSYDNVEDPPGQNNLRSSLIRDWNQSYSRNFSLQSDVINASETAVCFEDYGCFRIKYPERRGFLLWPESIDEINPTFCFYHLPPNGKGCPNICQIVDYETISQLNPPPLANGTSYFITHGYMENGNRPWIKDMACELLKRDPFASNVFVLDWADGAKPPYNQAVVNIELIGAYGARMMKILKETHGLQISKSHWIGHSLGAHLAGFVGSDLKTRYNSTLGRITGLDPAQPHFESYPSDALLDTSDAEFVDIIHTDARPLMEGGNVGVGLGIQGSHGHADFFPNNGKEQPGCKDGVYNAILQEDGSFIYGIRRFLGCDHMRAYEYFTESIRSTPCKFAAFACSSWDSFLSGNCTSRKNYMGLNARKPEITNMQASPEESGSKYYLVTGSKSPFCKDHFLLTISLKEEASYRGTSDLHLILHSGTGRGAVSSTLVIGWTELRRSSSDRDSSLSFTLLKEGSFPYPGPITRQTLRPSTSNPLLWFVNRMAPKTPDLVVSSITVRHLDGEAYPHVPILFCPEGKASFSISDQNPHINLNQTIGPVC